MKLLELPPPLPAPPRPDTYTYWTGCFAAKRDILALLADFQTQESFAFPSPSEKSHSGCTALHTSSRFFPFKAANDTRKINSEK
jgi:hypothetical protein